MRATPHPLLVSLPLVAACMLRHQSVLAQLPATVPPQLKRPQPRLPKPNPEQIPPRVWVPDVPHVPIKGGPKGASSNQTPPASAADDTSLPWTFTVRRFTLPNGLRVVIAPDHSAPRVGVSVNYAVGSRNEDRGRTGFAHFFEHMMYQGTSNVARGEHFRLIASAGGVLNGKTFTDRTRYETGVPVNALPLVLWLEADRMKGLNFSKENFDNQRDVIKEELRMAIENAAYIPSYVRLLELVYRGSPAYDHTPLGSFRDLDAADGSHVEDFFLRHYRPDNAVLAIVGDVDENAIEGQITSAFANVHAPKNAPAPFSDPHVPEQNAARSDILIDNYAPLPMLLVAWATARKGSPDHAALRVAATILGGSDRARLPNEWVQKRAIATDVSVNLRDFGTTDPFTITVQMAAGHKADEARPLLEKELEKLGKEGPSKEELARAKRQIATSNALSIEPFVDRANAFSDAEIQSGDANALRARTEEIANVTANDVARVVRTYLTEARRSLVEARPKAAEVKP